MSKNTQAKSRDTWTMSENTRAKMLGAKLRDTQLYCDPNRLLTDKQVANLLQVSRAHLHAGIKAGIFPPGFLLSQRTRRWRYRTIASFIDKVSGEEDSNEA